MSEASTTAHAVDTGFFLDPRHPVIVSPLFLLELSILGEPHSELHNKIPQLMSLTKLLPTADTVVPRHLFSLYLFRNSR